MSAARLCPMIIQTEQDFHGARQAAHTSSSSAEKRGPTPEMPALPGAHAAAPCPSWPRSKQRGGMGRTRGGKGALGGRGRAEGKEGTVTPHIPARHAPHHSFVSLKAS